LKGEKMDELKLLRLLLFQLSTISVVRYVPPESSFSKEYLELIEDILSVKQQALAFYQHLTSNVKCPPGFHDGPGFFETQIKNLKKEGSK